MYDYVTSRYADTRFSTNSYMNTIGDNLLLVTRICKGCYKMIFSDLDTLNKLLVDKDNDYLVDLDLKLPMAISYMDTEGTKYERFMASDSSILNTEDTNIYEAELWGKGIILRNEKFPTLYAYYEFDNEEISTSVSSKANLVLRRLEDTGWIELEMDPETYDEFIVLPNYSIICLESIFNVVNESSAGYSSLVHTMYSELYLENQNKDEFMYPSLLRAYENTKKLRVDLITLSHSIKIYQSRLAKLYTSNEVLHSYFDNY